MKPGIKALWLQALRGGEYEQGQRRLRSGDQFCCLGVLCDLAGKHGIGKWNGDAFKADGYQLVSTVLPSPVADWADLDELDPRIGKYGVSIYNDGSADYDIDPRTFAEIADLIEKEL